MPKILIIEDEKILAEMYKEKLESSGFEVVLAFTSEDGIKIAEREKPDLILLDILLPKENGIFFLKKWREKEEFSLTPIIAFSNYDDQETKKEAFQFGVKTYLIKTSLTPKELVEIIKNYLK